MPKLDKAGMILRGWRMIGRPVWKLVWRSGGRNRKRRLKIVPKH